MRRYVVQIRKAIETIGSKYKQLLKNEGDVAVGRRKSRYGYRTQDVTELY